MQHTGEEVKRAKINGVYSMVFRVYFAKTEIKISKSVVTVTPCETTLSVCVWVRVCVCAYGTVSWASSLPYQQKYAIQRYIPQKKKKDPYLYSHYLTPKITREKQVFI